MDDLPAKRAANAEAQRTNTLLEEIRNDVKAFGEAVCGLLATSKSVSGQLAGLEAWRENTESIMLGMPREFKAIRSDLGELKTDVRQLKTDVSGLKKDVSELKKDMKEVKGQLNDFTPRLSAVETKLAS